MVSEARGHFGGAALKIWHPSEYDISALSRNMISLTAKSLVITKSHTLQVSHTLEFGASCFEEKTL